MMRPRFKNPVDQARHDKRRADLHLMKAALSVAGAILAEIVKVQTDANRKVVRYSRNESVSRDISVVFAGALGKLARLDKEYCARYKTLDKLRVPNSKQVERNPIMETQRRRADRLVAKARALDATYQQILNEREGILTFFAKENAECRRLLAAWNAERP